MSKTDDKIGDLLYAASPQKPTNPPYPQIACCLPPLPANLLYLLKEMAEIIGIPCHGTQAGIIKPHRIINYADG